MRVLHSISRGDDTACLALVCGMRDAGVDCVVLAAPGSPAAIEAAQRRLPTLDLAGDGDDDADADADEILSGAVNRVAPDLVHVHGAPSGRPGTRVGAVRLAAILGGRAGVLTLGEGDLDANGLPPEASGLPGDARCAVLLPSCASRDADLVWARLGRSVRAVAWSSRLPMTQCAGLYGAMLMRAAPPRPTGRQAGGCRPRV